MPLPNLESLRAMLPQAGVEARRHLPGALGGAALGGAAGATLPDAEDGGERARNALIGALLGGAGGAGASRLMKGPAAAQLEGGVVPKLLENEGLSSYMKPQDVLSRDHRELVRRQTRKEFDQQSAAALQRGESVGTPLGMRPSPDATELLASNQWGGAIPGGPGGPPKQGSFQKRAFVRGIQAACTKYGVALAR